MIHDCFDMLCYFFAPAAAAALPVFAPQSAIISVLCGSNLYPCNSPSVPLCSVWSTPSSLLSPVPEYLISPLLSASALLALFDPTALLSFPLLTLRWYYLITFLVSLSSSLPCPRPSLVLTALSFALLYSLLFSYFFLFCSHPFFVSPFLLLTFFYYPLCFAPPSYSSLPSAPPCDFPCFPSSALSSALSFAFSSAPLCSSSCTRLFHYVS